MFGVVPKPLWERRIPADARNRIPLALRCLLVEHDAGLVLIDTGIGNKDDREVPRHLRRREHGRPGRRSSRTRSRRPASARRGALGGQHAPALRSRRRQPPPGAGWLRRPRFPNARYVVQVRELEFAPHTNERTQASYPPANFASVPFTQVDGEVEIVPGIRLLPTPGHVPHHSGADRERRRGGAASSATSCRRAPTCRSPWIMGYDLEPLVTLETKRPAYRRAEGEGWQLLFEHDPAVVAGRPGAGGEGNCLVEPRRRG